MIEELREKSAPNVSLQFLSVGIGFRFAVCCCGNLQTMWRE